MKMTYEVFCVPPDGGRPTAKVFECENDDEARRLAADYADECGSPVALCRARYVADGYPPHILPLGQIESRGQNPKTPERP